MVYRSVGRTSRAATGTAGSKRSIRTLRPPPGDALSAFRLTERPAARLGLRLVKGLPEAAARRISQCRAESPFRNVDELAMRAGLNEHELRLLASAGALDALAGHRRQALWQAAAQRPGAGILQSAPVRETTFALPAASEPQALAADYAHLGFTSGVIRWPAARATARATLHERPRVARLPGSQARPQCRHRHLSATPRHRQRARCSSPSRTRAASPTSSSDPNCSNVSAGRCSVPACWCFRPDQSPGTSGAPDRQPGGGSHRTAWTVGDHQPGFSLTLRSHSPIKPQVTPPVASIDANHPGKPT